jgi:rod shape determining protein RodA
MVHLDWFHYHFLFMLSLLLEPQYVILIALLAVIIVHFKSRMSHRNIVLSAILFALMSGSFCP